MERLGTGIGWRPEIAAVVEELPGIDWVEVVAENICPGHVPESLLRLRARGTVIVPHGVSLGLGGAERPDPARLAALAERAEALQAPLVTEHMAFVRAGGALTSSDPLEAGHLLPLPRTRGMLDVLCENVRIAQEALPVPLALENVAAHVTWPGEELTEGQFLAELVERTGVRLLIDVANLHTNRVNRGEDPATVLAALPLEALAYVHVAGGVERDGVWHDTHAHPVTAPVLDVLADLCARTDPPGVLLERDDDFPAAAELAGELGAIRRVLGEARSARGTAPRPPGTETAHAKAADATGCATDAATGATTVDPADATSVAPAAPTTAPTDAARQRLALAQASLLAALTTDAPQPEGFDPAQLRTQRRALAAKRAGVVAKVAPELPDILGDAYRPAFTAYARRRPMPGGYRRDALAFAEHVLAARPPELSGRTARRLHLWWRERSGPAPLPGGRAGRALRSLLAR